MGKLLPEEVKSHFPCLDRKENGREIIYLDSAATAQRPKEVIDALTDFYYHHNAHAPRGVHKLSAEATTMWENARKQVAKFINASRTEEVVFTRNATEGLNIVAWSWGEANLQKGDEIIMSVADHHSAFLPWRRVAQHKGAIIKYVKLTNTQEIDMGEYKQLLSDKTKMVCMVQVSNMLGCVLPVAEVCKLAHQVGAKVCLDACQGVPHQPTDVQAMGADFIVASGHKMGAPTGIGFLWGKYELLSDMPPFLSGGEMSTEVTLETQTWEEPPMRFEAGSAAMGEAVGLGAACQYLSKIGMDNIQKHGEEQIAYVWDKLSKVKDIALYGPPPSQPQGHAAVVCFNIKGADPADVCHFLDKQGIAVRFGHHNAHPVHQYLKAPKEQSVRASFYLYNTRQDVERFLEAVNKFVYEEHHVTKQKLHEESDEKL